MTKITVRKGFPTKSSLYRLAEELNVSITSLDNKHSMDAVHWQHKKTDSMKLFAEKLEQAGFTISSFSEYKPEEGRAGSFRISLKTK